MGCGQRASKKRKHALAVDAPLHPVWRFCGLEVGFSESAPGHRSPGFCTRFRSPLPRLSTCPWNAADIGLNAKEEGLPGGFSLEPSRSRVHLDETSILSSISLRKSVCRLPGPPDSVVAIRLGNPVPSQTRFPLFIDKSFGACCFRNQEQKSPDSIASSSERRQPSKVHVDLGLRSRSPFYFDDKLWSRFVSSCR